VAAQKRQAAKPSTRRPVRREEEPVET